MKFFQANMQTGILVLLVILVGIVCVALFFTNKEVRNIKAGIVKSRHDISALQTLLNDVGLTASGGRLGPDDPDNLIDQHGRGSPPQSQFGPPGSQGLPPGMEMFPPGMFPPGFDPSQLPPIQEQNDGQSPRSDGSKGSEEVPEELKENKNPEPLPANTESEPATLNLEKPEQPIEKKADVIPNEDVEEVKETVTKTTPKSTTKTAPKAAPKASPKVVSKATVEESSSEEEDSDEESSDEED